MRQLPASDAGWLDQARGCPCPQADDVCFACQREDVYECVIRFQQRDLFSYAIVRTHGEGREFRFDAVRSHVLIHHFAPRYDIDVPITSPELQAFVQQAGVCFDLDCNACHAAGTVVGYNPRALE